MKKLVGVLLAAPLLVLAPAFAQPSPPSPADAAEFEQRLVAAGHEWLQAEWRIAPDLPVDAALRESAQALVQQQQARLDRVFRRWVAEHRQIPDGGSAEVSPDMALKRMSVRFITEVALTVIDSPDASFDELVLPLLLKPGSCQGRIGHNWLEQQLLLLQSLSGARRERALSGLQTLLARWGEARPAFKPRGVPSFDEQALVAVEAVRDGAHATYPPMPPVLAGTVLLDISGPLDNTARCLLNQWWLPVALTAPGAPRDEVLAAYRLAMAPRAQERFVSAAADAPPVDNNGYPTFARRFDVVGEVRVQLSVDPQGKVLRAAVVRRDLRLLSLPDLTPLAFETALDEASLERARKAKFAKATSDAQAPRNFQVELVWKLE